MSFGMKTQLFMDKTSKNKIREKWAKGKDILDTFTKNFKQKGIDLKKIFSSATVRATVMRGQNRGFAILVEQKIGLPVTKLHCIVY